MNHRFLLRLVTNLAVVLLTLSCFGIVLWVIDEFLQWDILPDALSLLVQALLVSGGIIAFVMVVMNVLLSLSLLAEASASRAQLPNYAVSARAKRRVRRSIVVGLVAIALLIASLQITNQVRARVAQRAVQAEIAEDNTEFLQIQSDLNDSVDQVLDLFTPELVEAIATNTLVQKGQLSSTSRLFSSIQSSFAHSPSIKLLTRADNAPFKYSSIDSSSIRSVEGGNLSLTPELYTTFPTEQEVNAVQQLFSGELPAFSEPLAGQFLNNRVPSSWGVLRRNGQVVAIVYLQSTQPAADFNRGNFNFQIEDARKDFYHTGPDRLISN